MFVTAIFNNIYVPEFEVWKFVNFLHCISDLKWQFNFLALNRQRGNESSERLNHRFKIQKFCPSSVKDV